MRKNYHRPEMRAVQIQQRACILQASMTTFNTYEDDLEFLGGGNGNALVKGTSIWDDEW